MECQICKTKIDSIFLHDNAILVDIKSRSIKIYKNGRAHNYNDEEEFTIINLKAEDETEIKEFDFVKNDNNGYIKLLFCSVECFKKF